MTHSPNWSTWPTRELTITAQPYPGQPARQPSRPTPTEPPEYYARQMRQTEASPYQYAYWRGMWLAAMGLR